MNHLSAVGLILDIVGVVILAWAIVRATVPQIRAQAATAWGFNVDHARALIDQRADAFVGLPCLVVGFILQLFGTIGWPTPHSVLWWIALATLMLALCLYFFFFKHRWVNRRLEEVKKIVAEGEIDQAQVALTAQMFG